MEQIILTSEVGTLCNHHQHQSPEPFQLPKLKLCPHSTLAPRSPLLPAPDIQEYACCMCIRSVYLIILGTSRTQNLTICPFMSC